MVAFQTVKESQSLAVFALECTFYYSLVMPTFQPLGVTNPSETTISLIRYMCSIP